MKTEHENYSQRVTKALRLIAKQCPQFIEFCYWAGTSAISIEELGHRSSYDIDFHTRQALLDIRPILAEFRGNLPDQFELMEAPDKFGSGFRGVLKLPDGDRVTIEVLSNFEDVSDDDLTDSATVPDVKRITLSRYLENKIQCVAERAEARDLVDIRAVLDKFPEMRNIAFDSLLQQDSLLIAERLLLWNDESIKDDLLAYPDVNPDDAVKARDMLLRWLNGEHQEDKT